MVDLSEFDHPRLVAVYDALNSYQPGEQPDFYLALARQIGAQSVVEIGCGTGLISQLFIHNGYDFTGVEPAPAMLSRAKQRPGSHKARWVEGDASALLPGRADFAFMAGHVAQFFLTDEAWHAALTSIGAALRPHGCLAFESRNPAARAWQEWSRAERRTTVHPEHGAIETWTEVHDFSDSVLSYTLHYRFISDGEHLAAPTRLRFRSYDEIEASLTAAGFAIESTYGYWDRRPVDTHSMELILVAKKS
jgi:SAM-dependent methyltransferase